MYYFKMDISYHCIFFMWNIISYECTSSVLLYESGPVQTEGDHGYLYEDENSDYIYEIESGMEDVVVGVQPTFDVAVANVTVIAGQDALLPCSIDHLGKRQVVWLDDSFNVLTYEEIRKVDDPRFTVLRPKVHEWNLQISEVTREDQGSYRCTVNTKPIISKTVMLHVKVPAKIIDELSSDDMIVQEGETVVLVCNVTGVPRPTVTWYRHPALGLITEAEEVERIQPTGEMVIIENITRHCDYIYECVASNGVGDSSTSRQMRVNVEYPPEVKLPNYRQWQDSGKETILVCRISAYPQAQTYWMKNGQRIVGSHKFSIETYNEVNSDVLLSLRIAELEEEDFGKYTCFASNKLGNAQNEMWLKENRVKTTTMSTTKYVPENNVIYFRKGTTYTVNNPARPLAVSSASFRFTSVRKLMYLTVIMVTIFLTIYL